MKEQGTMHFQQRKQEMMKELGERQMRKTLKIHLKITEKQLKKKKTLNTFNKISESYNIS